MRHQGNGISFFFARPSKERVVVEFALGVLKIEFGTGQKLNHGSQTISATFGKSAFASLNNKRWWKANVAQIKYAFVSVFMRGFSD